jgi:hypothetical protein
MAFKIKDGVRIGTVDVFNNAGTLLVAAPSVANSLTAGGGLTGGPYNGSSAVTIAHTNNVTAATVSEGGAARTLAYSGTFNIPSVTFDANGHVTATGTTTLTLPAAIAAANNGTLTLGVGAAGATNTTVTIATGTGFSANTASNITYQISVGPSLTNLATLMNTAGAGFIKRGATANTYTIDTATYLTGNQSITLSGDATGSGTTSIPVTLATVNSNVGTFNNVTVNGKGLVTAASNVSYLTAEEDTLQTVTGRGATSDVATISLLAATASTTTSTGALVVTGGVGVGGALNVGGSVVVGGNLIVNGTTTTINSTTTTLDDPVITLGGDTAPTSDDNKDRGVEYRWHNGTVAKIGFFGYDDSTGKFTFIPDATNTAEVFSGTKGTIDANIEWNDVINKPAIGTVTSVSGTGTVSGLTLTGTVTTSGSLTLGGTLAVTPANFASQTTKTFLAAPNTANGVPTFRTIVASDIPTLNQNTTGSAATLTTGRTIAMTGDVTYTSPGFNGSGNVTAVATLATVNFNVGTFNSVTVNAKGLVTAASNVAYLTAEADTLATVTARGATTGTAIALTNATNATSATTGALVITGGLAVNANIFAKGSYLNANSAGTIINARDVIRTTVAATALTAVDSWPVATYRSAKYLVQITQGTNHQFSEIMVIHNGTTTQMTEYAVLETNGALGTFTTDVNTGNARLLVTMGTATSATISIDRIAMAV